MRSVVSVCLILFLLVGQSFAAAPHWHFDQTEVEAGQHADRPHVHWHGDHDHGHHHAVQTQEELPTELPPGSESTEHDDDALYVSIVDLVVGSVSVELPELLLIAIWQRSLSEQLTAAMVSPTDSTGQAISDSPHPRCALYMQLLSIRC
ncbi:hypothetical protein AB1L30_06260 [Bremerella sp. JC817]|uniref:hypothetical protein n=1 Tax=Bremerella sp. JC817 TaxID=3231756 RepID=UPI00345825B4